MKNQKGFVAAILPILFPFLIIAILVLFAGCMILLQWRQTHELCQTSLLKTQKVMSTGFNDLFALNAEAERLRAEKIAAKKALTAAFFFPLAIPAAQNYLSSVITRQGILRAKQEAIKMKMRTEGNIALSNLKINLARERGVDGQPIVTPLTLAVRQSPQFDLTPDHIPLPNFEKLQVLQGRWRLNSERIFPEWMYNLLPKLDRINGKCSARLEQKGNLWLPFLGEARSSQN